MFNQAHGVLISEMNEDQLQRLSELVKKLVPDHAQNLLVKEIQYKVDADRLGHYVMYHDTRWLGFVGWFRIKKEDFDTIIGEKSFKN